MTERPKLFWFVSRVVPAALRLGQGSPQAPGIKPERDRAVARTALISASFRHWGAKDDVEMMFHQIF
jgi:hypothetical protein